MGHEIRGTLPNPRRVDAFRQSEIWRLAEKRIQFGTGLGGANLAGEFQKKCAGSR